MRLACAILILAASSNAQAAPDADKARAHFQVAQGLYKLGDFRGAIKEFSAGYELTHKAGFLLNLAQSYRQLHELARARDFYRQFLAEAGADDVSRPVATQLLGEVEAELRVLPPEPPPLVMTQPSPAPLVLKTPLVVASSPPARSNHRALRVSGIVVGLVGLGLAGGGIGAAVAADGAARDLNKLNQKNGVFDSGKDDRYHLDRALEGGLVGVGAALAVTGVILLGVSARK